MSMLGLSPRFARVGIVTDQEKHCQPCSLTQWLVLPTEQILEYIGG